MDAYIYSAHTVVSTRNYRIVENVPAIFWYVLVFALWNIRHQNFARPTLLKNNTIVIFCTLNLASIVFATLIANISRYSFLFPSSRTTYKKKSTTIFIRIIRQYEARRGWWSGFCSQKKRRKKTQLSRKDIADEYSYTAHKDSSF